MTCTDDFSGCWIRNEDSFAKNTYAFMKGVIYMFERIKAYKKIKKINKSIKGYKLIAELTGDEEMLKKANETLYLNEKIKKMMWRNRKLAVNYNLETIKRGF